ncbi:MAG: YcgL domain-containing protein [Pseudomonadota bacterium]
MSQLDQTPNEETPCEPIEVMVYRSPRRAETYLYLPRRAEFDTLPEALRQQFGEGEAFLDFVLDAQRKLALVDAAEVLRALRTQGFYLQLPPRQDHVPSAP